MRQTGHGKATVEIAKRQLVIAEDGCSKIDEMALLGRNEVTGSCASML
jgi:hypothetical protein